MKSLERIVFSACLIILLFGSFNVVPAKNVNTMEPQLEGFDGVDAPRELNPTENVPRESPLSQDKLREIMQAQEAEEESENGTYNLIWEPNRIQGSVHSVAVYGTIVAVGAGYLYDNEVHVYRWNSSAAGADGLKHMWDAGDGVFKSDILALVFGDTDRDSYIEFTAGCADGHVYVFEQRSTAAADLTYYEFQLVWNTSVSEIGKRISSVVVDDLDSDGIYEVVAGAWTRKLYVFEYSARFGSSGSTGHRHYYRKVWDSGEAIMGLVNSVATGDTDSDGFREIVAGASDNRVYVFENAMDTSPEPVYPHIDDAYRLIWNSSNHIQGPINSVAVDSNIDLDADGEIVAVSSGHGAYVFDYSDYWGNFTMYKLMREVESWETNPSFPIDHYVDMKKWGNSSTGVYEPSVIPPPYSPDYLRLNATAMAGPRDWYAWEPFENVTLLDGSGIGDGFARVVLDFGADEEITGQGNFWWDMSIYGIEFLPSNVSYNNFFVYISQDGSNFTEVTKGLYPVSKTYFDYHGSIIAIFDISIDIDPMLNSLGWDWFRYIKIETSSRVYLDAVEGTELFRPVSDAISVSTGWIPGLNTTNGDFKSKIIIGTTTGTIKVFSQFPLLLGVNFKQTWDSYRPVPLYQPGTTEYRKRFSMANNIWTISLATKYSFFMPLRRFMVVGTYPKVAFVEVNATTLEASSVWDTGNILDKWTMAVDLADSDGDGKQEVIVGSFDSNIYVFDHVSRSTYRRAWRSPDVKHNETFWDHVTDVIVGDYDDDGKLELLASTDNRTYPLIHVFENTGKNQFVASEAVELPKSSGPVVALDLGDDLDADGVNEIVALAQRTVYVFEKKGDGFVSSSFLVSINGEGLALATADSDGDGFGEIIVGGRMFVYGSAYVIEAVVHGQGFAHVYENYGNGTVLHLDNQYRQVWSAPLGHMSSPSLVFTVHSVSLDDQDDDNKTEIIVGHSLGINIYECTGDNSFGLSQIITSSASYPVYNPTESVTLPDNYCPGPFGSGPFNRYEGAYHSSACVAQYSNGTYIMVYTALDTSIPSTTPPSYPYNMSRLFYSKSLDGISWAPARRVTNDSQYSMGDVGRSYLYYERTPSIVITPIDEVWITYEAKFVWSGELPALDIIPWVFVTKLETAFPSLDLSRIDYEAVSPSIFWNSTSLTLGLAYLNYTQPFEGRNVMYLCKSAWNVTVIGGIPPFFRFYVYPDWKASELQNSVIGSQFVAYSLDTAYINNSTLAVVFAGMNYSAPRDPDVWFMTANATDPSSWTPPSWISLSGDGDDSPSIAVLSGNVLAVAYRRNVVVGPHLMQWQIYITASADGGWSWTRPQRLPTSSYQSYAPSISALRDGGFMYSFHASTSQSSPASPAIFFGQNPLEGWWLYTIGSVQCLATGDTDGDHRSEIIAGSLSEIFKLELTDIGNSTRYLQTWISPTLPQMVTDIATGDINGDGVSEIVATAAGGNVYAYKWIEKE